MPNTNWKRILGTYGLFGPALGMFPLLLVEIFDGESRAKVVFTQIIPAYLLFGYVFGLFPALAAGWTRIYAGQQRWHRWKTFSAACVVGSALALAVATTLSDRENFAYEFFSTGKFLFVVAVSVFSTLCLTTWFFRSVDSRADSLQTTVDTEPGE